MIYFTDIHDKLIPAPGHILSDGKLGGPDTKYQEVVCVQADGHELEALYKLIPDLPKVNKHVVRFTGPWAQLIAYNL